MTSKAEETEYWFQYTAATLATLSVPICYIYQIESSFPLQLYTIERHLAYGKQMEREHPPTSGTRPYLGALAMTYSVLRDWRFSLINHTLSQLQRDMHRPISGHNAVVVVESENCITQLVACRMRCPMVHGTHWENWDNWENWARSSSSPSLLAIALDD